MPLPDTSPRPQPDERELRKWAIEQAVRMGDPNVVTVATQIEQYVLGTKLEKL